MRIGMILNAGFPPDIRIEKEVWKKEINQFIRKNQLDALHVHDLPLAGTALEAARSHRIPIVLDLHEDYPAMLAEIHKMPWSRIPSAGVLGLRLASVPRWREYEQNYGPVPHDAKSDQISDDKTVTAVYIGGFDQARDLQTVMNAADLLADRGCNHLKILLVGGSKRDIVLLRNYASTKRLDVNNVSFREWMERDDAESILDEAHIGLVPHVKSAHTDSTIPHKLFQYMARRLPVVVSNCVPLQRIVTDTGCGIVYESGNAQSMAVCLEELYRNSDKRARMGIAGLTAVQKTYNWTSPGTNLLNLYQQLHGA